MLLLYIAIATLTGIFIIKASQFYRRYSRGKKLMALIPAPPATSIFGHISFFTQNAGEFFERIRKNSKDYYPIYRLSIFWINVLNFLEPSDIEVLVIGGWDSYTTTVKIFQVWEEAYCQHTTNHPNYIFLNQELKYDLVLSTTKHLSKSKVYTFLHNWLGTGIFTSTGAKWHKRRKLLTPAFHSSILQQFLGVFNVETIKLIEKLAAETGNIIDLKPPVTNFTLHSIAETAMGFDTIDECTQKEYLKAIHKLTRIIFRRLSIPWYRSKAIYRMSKLAQEENAVVKVLHDFSDRIITEREKERTTNISKGLSDYSKKKRLAMLDLLLAAKNEGADIDYEGIREEVDTFMFAGYDTTSLAISFMLLVLANLQKVQAKVLEEILSVVGPSKLPTYNDLKELKYTERCIKETLRLFPSVPMISRYASEDFITKTGYHITEGTILHVHIFDVHRSENIYPNPLKFDPDRFLPENISQRHPFAYIPFSAGPRNCLGQKFVFVEMKTVLCGILRKFQLEKVDDMFEIEFKSDLVLRPKNGIKVKILLRE